jgi:hypothetical protein
VPNKKAKPIELKPFQQRTVDEILHRVGKNMERGVRLALADEVGLGKTHVLAATASKLSEDDAKLIYYVAPSREVADQNSPKISDACGIDPKSKKKTNTRLTLLPVYFPRDRRVHVISITPWTSFHLSGPGNREERAFLLQVVIQLRKQLQNEGRWPYKMIYVGKSNQFKFPWDMVLFRPRFRENYTETLVYQHWIQRVKAHSQNALPVVKSMLKSQHEWLPQLAKALEKCHNSGTHNERTAWSLTSKVVSVLRYEVAKLVFCKSHRPDVIFFDEWHKYDQFLTARNPSHADSGILATALRVWHSDPQNAPKLTLLVSATPFEVSLDKNSNLESMSGLARLCRVIDPTNETSNKVESVRSKFQSTWEAYRDALISGHKSLITRSHAYCNDAAERFSSELQKFIIRTERPKEQIADGRGSETQDYGVWSKADLGTLQKLDLRNSSTDIVGLWSASSHFPLMADSYKFARDLLTDKDKKRIKAIALCQNQHWKRERLIEEIRKRWGKGNRKVTPPLWIPSLETKSETHFGKILIFSSWRAVPQETAYFLSDKLDGHFWKLGRSVGSTPLGVFPRHFSEASVNNVEHGTNHKLGWRVFYPLLGGRLIDKTFVRWLKHALQSRPASLIHTGHRNWCRLLVALDVAYAEWLEEIKDPLSQLFHSAAEARQECLDVYFKNRWADEFAGLSARQVENLLITLTGPRSLAKLPGAEYMDTLLNICGPEAALAPNAQSAILESTKEATNYFNRDISQGIIRAQFPNEEYVEAVRKYCGKNGWKEMLTEFIRLLWADCRSKPRVEPVAILAVELGAAMSVRAATTGRSWSPGAARPASIVQPFIETKEQAQKISQGNQDQNSEEIESDEARYSTTRRRKAFNSPFLPLVLVSTSIGQEGVDFHRYCDTVIHWNPPESPLALEQREGRVDRFCSFQVRKAWKTVHDGDYEDSSGLSPDFCVMNAHGHRVNSTDRRVWVLPFSREYRTWQRCLERLLYFQLFVGAPDPATLEAELQLKMEGLTAERKREVLNSLSRISVKLTPVSRPRANGRKKNRF